jgi:hypothetical protein
MEQIACVNLWIPVFKLKLETMAIFPENFFKLLVSAY